MHLLLFGEFYPLVITSKRNELLFVTYLRPAWTGALFSSEGCAKGTPADKYSSATRVSEGRELVTGAEASSLTRHACFVPAVFLHLMVLCFVIRFKCQIRGEASCAAILRNLQQDETRLFSNLLAKSHTAGPQPSE
jgi:hypothetical protein